MTKWNDGNSTPDKLGWYLRDYRSAQVVQKKLPPFSVDLFEPEPNKHSALFPGCWYVLDGESLNDAGYQHLPWKRIKT